MTVVHRQVRTAFGKWLNNVEYPDGDVDLYELYYLCHDWQQPDRYFSIVRIT